MPHNGLSAIQLDSMRSQMNVLLSRMATMEERMDTLIQDRASYDAMSNHMRMQESTIRNQAKELETLRRANRKLQRIVDATKYSSPDATAKSPPAVLPPSDTLTNISSELERAAMSTNEVGTSETRILDPMNNNICTVNVALMAALPPPAAAPRLSIATLH